MSFFIRYCNAGTTPYYQAERGPTATFANAQLFATQALADAFIAAHAMCAASFTDAAVTVTVTSGTSVVPPPNVFTFAPVIAWGGGGGGCDGAAVNGRPGGGGGAFSRIETVTVVPGVAETIQIGQGGAHGIPGAAATDTFFRNAGTLLAKGGTGGPNNDATFGTGGLSAAGVGTTKFSGGDGAPRAAAVGGGGGSSAGTAADGGTAIGSAGGIPPANGAAGGAHNADGTAPGGAGGGGDGLVAGGAGKNGQIIYSYVIGV